LHPATKTEDKTRIRTHNCKNGKGNRRDKETR